MAIVGMAILCVARVERSLPMAQAHWAIANSCGAILACFMLVRGSSLTSQQVWQRARSVALSVAVVALSLLMLPESSIGSQPWWKLILVLAKDGLIYGVAVIALAMLCRLTSFSKLKKFLRFQ
jgi:predicted Na+-dependent transporter